MRLRTEARGNVMESDLALERDLKREAVQTLISLKITQNLLLARIVYDFRSAA
ncbi:hypothetical protein Csa_008556 [Cucumis sativus]|uniref:Uncharacterized protein n=1 Tax=Cucumis sativus TaxID=3659 RepID=A0A0A0KUT5_CUCSA|nr:hypothetical protein Csa_008556 [Cucumis sativus]